jgi:hypothetical protein
MPKLVSYNNVASFNADWAATKSEAEFIEHEKGTGLTDEQLKEVYSLCKAAVGQPIEVEPAPGKKQKPDKSAPETGS